MVILLICYDLLYKPYDGTPNAFYGYTGYLLYDNYGVDSSSCAGFIFSLTTRVYDPLENLWKSIGRDKKRLIVKEILKRWVNNANFGY